MNDKAQQTDEDQGGAHPVLVTGATGRIGRAVVDELLAAGVPVRALTRDPAAADLPAGVEVVAGDFADPASLDPALRGVRSVFLLWTAPPATAGAVIERIAAYTRRIVFLSSPHRTPHPFFQQPNPMADLHAAIERLIAASGLDSTILRPGMFASNVRLWWEATINAGEPVRWPYVDVGTAPIDERDLAAVAARTLYEDGHTGGDYVLTGPEALTHAEQVRVIGDVIGRPVPFEELTPDEFRRATEGVWPRPVVDMLLDAWGASEGHPAYVTTTVADVLGVPARTFREWATDQWKMPL
ncbi:NAD(P)H-binding protein [Streptomyces endophyticus]|uniref:NAD(P)H-binding protein n=1 Tax=Streptomyces endophyticus TaxID=714166 RepID=A0ABU6F6A3_9ACTN|nr:NAD(P)H-binding protein [Streptomyces endophyticus]MEB8338880.1 NAD(P)H-binding protein [Streptomyces endophyticus]